MGKPSKRSGTYGARPQIDSVLDLAVLEPGPTLLLPDSRLVEGVKVRIDLVERILLDRHGLDTLCLHLLHALDAILNRSLDRRQQSAVAPCGAGSDNSVVVGEAGRRDTKVEIRAVDPIFLDRLALAIDDLEGRLESYLEACSAHQDIHFVYSSVNSLDAFWNDALNATHDGCYVGLNQRLEVAVTGRDSTASRGPLGNDERLELLMTGPHTAVHFLGDDFTELL